MSFWLPYFVYYYNFLNSSSTILLNEVSFVIRGTTSTEEEEFDKQWSECAEHLKDCLNSVVLPIGSLSVGLCVHRALLFKVNLSTWF